MKKGKLKGEKLPKSKTKEIAGIPSSKAPRDSAAAQDDTELKSDTAGTAYLERLESTQHAAEESKRSIGEKAPSGSIDNGSSA